MKIHEKLKDARTVAKLTQEDLAEKIGVSRQTISSWENGKSYPDIGSLIMLSDLYEISLNTLLKGDSDMIKKLKENTDVVSSNKKVIGIYVGWIILFLVLYFIRSMVNMPKIEDLFVNIAILSVAGIILIYQMFKQLMKTSFLKRQTSNKTIVKVGIGLLYIISICLAFSIIKQFINTEWQVIAARAVCLLVLAIPFGIAFKMIDKVK